MIYCEYKINIQEEDMKNINTSKTIGQFSYPNNFKESFKTINNGEFQAQPTPEPTPKRAHAEHEPKADSRFAINELDNLIGLENVKKTIKELVVFLQRRGKDALPCLHMVFTGNPGTAKTTVARIVARIFAESGITSRDLLVETDRGGLVGGYVGQTALKTEKIIKKSLGGVLFIDEAYSLFSDSDRDYGNEAVATLVKAMEDKRDEFVCIMAGYTKEMNAMIDMNPGLRDRVQFYIDFPDYADTELMQIFDGFCNEKKYHLTKPARNLLIKELALFAGSKNKNFANGRFVRKLFERICIKQAQRTSGYNIIERDITAALESPDIASICKIGNCKAGKTKIGFSLA
jgi:SpoVK/Ycf46/Vps4 family AAA+-type ATPase